MQLLHLSLTFYLSKLLRNGKPFWISSKNSECQRIFRVTGANQNAWKLLSTDLVNTKTDYQLGLVMRVAIFLFGSIGTWIFVGSNHVTWSSVSKVCLGARKVCTWQAARDTFLSKRKMRLSWEVLNYCKILSVVLIYQCSRFVSSRNAPHHYVRLRLCLHYTQYLFSLLHSHGSV